MGSLFFKCATHIDMVPYGHNRDPKTHAAKMFQLPMGFIQFKPECNDSLEIRNNRINAPNFPMLSDNSFSLDRAPGKDDCNSNIFLSICV